MVRAAWSKHRRLRPTCSDANRGTVNDAVLFEPNRRQVWQDRPGTRRALVAFAQMGHVGSAGLGVRPIAEVGLVERARRVNCVFSLISYFLGE